MENIFSQAEDRDAPALRIETRIEEINPLPVDFQWPPGVPGTMFKKITVSTSLTPDFPSDIRHIALEIAYADSKGNWLRRNSAPYGCDGRLFTEAVPLIWDAKTANREYHASFSRHSDSNTIKFFIKVSFSDAAIPTRLFEGTIALSQSTAFHYFFIPKSDL